MSMLRTVKSILAAASLSLMATVLAAAGSYSPYSNEHYPDNVYWGDTHVHSNLSYDATLMENIDLSQANAYEFARGDTVTAHNGMKVRLHRPLDFLVVADHAGNLGVWHSINNDDPALLKTENGKRLHHLLKVELKDDRKKALEFMAEGDDRGAKITFAQLIQNKAYHQTIWRRVTETADQYNAPGRFTTFSGFEWTSFGSGSPKVSEMGNLHRVVVFKDGADKASSVVPFSSLDSEDPEDLWAYMASYENQSGGEVLAIPHNSNLSKGEMFSLVNYRGQPIDTAYAKTRSRWEPLMEVTQIKGDSEAHPALSPNDEFADHETWNTWHFAREDDVGTEAWLTRKKSEYARSALGLGLQQQVSLGVNPFKFGLIGSTDAHTSLATADDDNFWGKVTTIEPNPERLLNNETEYGVFSMAKFSASGYAAVWAKENTRESLFAAMKRKEVYASTGPRISVRFFGGWDYQQGDAFRPDLARVGYEKGVPMGSDLTQAPQGKVPHFLIRAVRDPDGANLDRVQVIKGWHDDQGELHEKVYDVALSDKRKANSQGNVSPVGNTVDIPNASYRNTIGDPELAVVWQDPDFDPNELAFYYARVIEIPTPRWTAYDAKFFTVKNVPERIPMVTQERAYTSPIWYTPSD